MTLKEVSIRFCIDFDRLRGYEESGLLTHATLADGTFDYSESDVSRIGLINELFKSGMNTDEVKIYRAADKNGQLRLLRKQRCKLLEEIHSKQQVLDELDYMIGEAKNSQRKGNYSA